MCILVALVSTCSLKITCSAAVTEESIKAKENQISQAKKERDSLKNAKTDLEKVKKQLEASKTDLNNYITQLDGQLSDIQARIDALADEISEKEQQIETTTAELEEAEAIQQAQYEAMKKRIKFMYERGDTLYFEMLLESGSFADMLNKAEYIEMLSSYDRLKLNEYIETTELIRLTKEALEEEKRLWMQLRQPKRKKRVIFRPLLIPRTVSCLLLNQISPARKRLSRPTRMRSRQRMLPSQLLKERLLRIRQPSIADIPMMGVCSHGHALITQGYLIIMV